MYKCGDCEHWMKKSDCPREKAGDKPTCNSHRCEKFTLTQLRK